MIVIRECDERGRESRPVDPLERAKLHRDYLRHAMRQNNVIDWEAYNSSYFGHLSMLDLSSERDSDDSDDSDCVFLYSTSGKEVVAYANLQMTRGKGFLDRTLIRRLLVMTSKAITPCTTIKRRWSFLGPGEKKMSTYCLARQAR